MHDLVDLKSSTLVTKAIIIINNSSCTWRSYTMYTVVANRIGLNSQNVVYNIDSFAFYVTCIIGFTEYS